MEKSRLDGMSVVLDRRGSTNPRGPYITIPVIFSARAPAAEPGLTGIFVVVGT